MLVVDSVVHNLLIMKKISRVTLHFVETIDTAMITLVSLLLNIFGQEIDHLVCLGLFASADP